MRADRGGWNATVLEFRRAASAITCVLEGRIHGLNSVSVEMENNTKPLLNILIDPLTFKSFADSSVKVIKNGIARSHWIWVHFRVVVYNTLSILRELHHNMYE